MLRCTCHVNITRRMQEVVSPEFVPCHVAGLWSIVYYYFNRSSAQCEAGWQKAGRSGRQNWPHNMVSVSLRNPNFARRPTWNKASHNCPENNLIILHFIYHFMEQYWTTLKMKNQSEYNETDVSADLVLWNEEKANSCLEGRKRKRDDRMFWKMVSSSMCVSDWAINTDKYCSE